MDFMKHSNIRELPDDIREQPGGVQELPGDIRELPGDIRELPGNIREENYQATYGKRTTMRHTGTTR